MNKNMIEQKNELKNIGVVLKDLTEEEWRKFEKLVQCQDLNVLFVKKVPNSVKLKIVEYSGVIKNVSEPSSR